MPGPPTGHSFVQELATGKKNNSLGTFSRTPEFIDVENIPRPAHAHTHAHEFPNNSLQAHHNFMHFYNQNSLTIHPGNYPNFSSNSNNNQAAIDLRSGTVAQNHKNNSESEGHSTSSQSNQSELRRLCSGYGPIKRRLDSTNSVGSTGSPTTGSLSVSTGSPCSDVEPPVKKKSNRGRKPGQCEFNNLDSEEHSANRCYKVP